ncbi:unnamed protein product, partial [Ilex paraguariensis]
YWGLNKVREAKENKVDGKKEPSANPVPRCPQTAYPALFQRPQFALTALIQLRINAPSPRFCLPSVDPAPSRAPSVPTTCK